MRRRHKLYQSIEKSIILSNICQFKHANSGSLKFYSIISQFNCVNQTYISSKNSLVTYFYFFKELLDYLLFRQLTDAKGFVFYDILFIYIQMQMIQGLRSKLKKIA